jgi:hypothetical protein
MSTSERPADRTRFHQNQWKSDPTFYPTARLAMEAPAERYAYVAALVPDQKIAQRCGFSCRCRSGIRIIRPDRRTVRSA